MKVADEQWLFKINFLKLDAGVIFWHWHPRVVSPADGPRHGYRFPVAFCRLRALDATSLVGSRDRFSKMCNGGFACRARSHGHERAIFFLALIHHAHTQYISAEEGPLKFLKSTICANSSANDAQQMYAHVMNER